MGFSINLAPLGDAFKSWGDSKYINKVEEAKRKEQELMNLVNQYQGTANPQQKAQIAQQIDALVNQVGLEADPNSNALQRAQMVAQQYESERPMSPRPIGKVSDTRGNYMYDPAKQYGDEYSFGTGYSDILDPITGTKIYDATEQVTGKTLSGGLQELIRVANMTDEQFNNYVETTGRIMQDTDVFSALDPATQDAIAQAYQNKDYKQLGQLLYQTGKLHNRANEKRQDLDTPVAERKRETELGEYEKRLQKSLEYKKKYKIWSDGQKGTGGNKSGSGDNPFGIKNTKQFLGYVGTFEKDVDTRSATYDKARNDLRALIDTVDVNDSLATQMRRDRLYQLVDGNASKDGKTVLEFGVEIKDLAGGSLKNITGENQDELIREWVNQTKIDYAKNGLTVDPVELENYAKNVALPEIRSAEIQDRDLDAVKRSVMNVKQTRHEYQLGLDNRDRSVGMVAVFNPEFLPIVPTTQQIQQIQGARADITGLQSIRDDLIDKANRAESPEEQNNLWDQVIQVDNLITNKARGVASELGLSSSTKVTAEQAIGSELTDGTEQSGDLPPAPNMPGKRRSEIKQGGVVEQIVTPNAPSVPPQAVQEITSGTDGELQTIAANPSLYIDDWNKENPNAPIDSYNAVRETAINELNRRQGKTTADEARKRSSSRNRANQ